MKKLMLSLAVVAALGFTSCSSDDDKGGSNDDGCQTCASYEFEGTTIPAVEVCEGENGNAFIGNQDTTIDFGLYITAQETLTTCE